MIYRLKSKLNLVLMLLMFIFVYFSYIRNFSSIHLFNVIISFLVFGYYLFRNTNDIILLKLIVYLMFFDINNLFTFGGSLNLRIWYFLVIFLLIKTFFAELSTQKIKFKKVNVIIVIFLILFSLFSIYLNGSSFHGFLLLARLLVFFFPVLLLFIKLINEKKDLYEMMFFFSSMVLFSTLTGIIQMFFLTQGKDIMFALGTMRPQAYFSETTWYSQYAVIGLVIALIQDYESKWVKYFILFVNIFAVVLSMTRNSILGLILIFAYILLVRRKKEEIISLLTVLFIALFSYSIALTQSSILFRFDFITDKFDLTDASAMGRIDAIRANIVFLMRPRNFLIGSGFAFNDASELSGSAIGAKSFNLFLAIFSSAGVVIFTLTSIIIGRIYFKYFVSYKKNDYNAAGLLIFTIYLLYSMFAPFHFYPLSWFVLGLSMLLLGFPESYSNSDKL